MNTIVVAILNSVFYIIILVLFYLFLRFIFRSVKKIAKQTGLQNKYILIVFVIVSLIFQNTIIFFFRNLIKFIVEIIRLPFDTINLFISASPNNEGSYNYEAFIEMYHKTLSLTYDFFSGTNWGFLLLFFIVWFLLCVILKRIIVGSDLKSDEGENLKILRANLLSIGVLLFGAYLCLVTIIAIPIVNIDIKENRITKDELVSDLNKNTVNLGHLYIDSTLFNNYNSLDTNDTNLINEYKKEKEYYLISVKQSLRRIENKKRIVEIKFEEGLLKKIDNKALLEYKNELTGWFFDYIEEELKYLDKFQYKVKTLGLKKKAENQDLNPDYILDIMLDYTKELYGYNEPFPPLPKPADACGFLGKISAWLINTESIAFVLIVGLLGFGLLGAVGAQLIKGVNKRIKVVKKNDGLPTGDLPGANDGLFIENLPAAIVKGTTAALVVFLAIKGGMAIITTSDSDNINPYSLFFICFAASVYSSDVWKWAKEKMEKSLNIGNRPPLGNQTGTQKGKPTENQPENSEPQKK